MIFAHAYKRGVANEAIVLVWPVPNCLMRLQSCEKAMGWCTAHCKMLLFCAKTTWESHNFELPHLKEKMKKETKTFWLFANFLVRYFCIAFLPHYACCWSWKHSKMNGMLSYRLTSLQFLRFFVLSQLYCMSVKSLHTVYRIDDTRGSGKKLKHQPRKLESAKVSSLCCYMQTSSRVGSMSQC